MVPGCQEGYAVGSPHLVYGSGVRGVWEIFERTEGRRWDGRSAWIFGEDPRFVGCSRPLIPRIFFIHSLGYQVNMFTSTRSSVSVSPPGLLRVTYYLYNNDVLYNINSDPETKENREKDNLDLHTPHHGLPPRG